MWIKCDLTLRSISCDVRIEQKRLQRKGSRDIKLRSEINRLLHDVVVLGRPLPLLEGCDRDVELERGIGRGADRHVCIRELDAERLLRRVGDVISECVGVVEKDDLTCDLKLPV